jgi:hypothetical protein
LTGWLDQSTNHKQPNQKPRHTIQHQWINLWINLPTQATQPNQSKHAPSR